MSDININHHDNLDGDGDGTDPQSGLCQLLLPVLCAGAVLGLLQAQHQPRDVPLPGGPADRATCQQVLREIAEFRAQNQSAKALKIPAL